MNRDKYDDDFTGHKLVKIDNKDFVLDLTEYKVYKVVIDSNFNVSHYDLAFEVEKKDKEHGYTIEQALKDIPVSIIFNVLKKIKVYEKGARIL